MNNNICFDDLKKYVYDNEEDISILEIALDQIIFEDCVKLKCYYCNNYNQKWSCPPRIPDVDYKSVFKEYDNFALIIYISNLEKDNFEIIRKQSTLKIHTLLLSLEKYLWDNNYPLALSFIGGSCKLCKNGCAIDKCRNKNLSRIPIEALGVNVIKTLKNINVDVVFPPNTKLLRCGLIMW